jgi:hypothetical protein
MITALCAKKKIEETKINEIEYQNSRPRNHSQTIKGTENIPWLFDTGAQAMCLSEKLFRKIPAEITPKKMITNRRFVVAGGQAQDPVGIFNLSFTWTDKEGRLLAVLNDEIVMKTLNSGAIMGLDLIRKMGLIYRSRKYVFKFEDTYQSKYVYQIASLIARKEIFIPARSSQSTRVATKLDRFNIHCPQITSLCEIACPEFKQIM